jgi:hypothetical protein
MAIDQEPRIVRTTTEVRQSVTDHYVRYVLIYGTAAVVILFVVLWLYYFA